MDFQEQFIKEQLKLIHEAREAEEDNFEKIQQEQREKVKQSNSNISTRDKEIAEFIKIQNKEMEDFVAEREKLLTVHEDKKVNMKRRHWEEEVELENELTAELNRLMEKYAPQPSQEEGNNNDQ